MEQLVHKASGELVTDDPFTVVGNRFRLTQDGLSAYHKGSGFYYIITEEDSEHNSNASDSGVSTHLVDPRRPGSHDLRLFDRRYLTLVNDN